ncbi:MAG: DUF2199 domain-containing protein [Lewinella sp.]
MNSQNFTVPSTYTCSHCGEIHEGWPALGFPYPSYHCLKEEERASLAELNEDFCVITYPDQTDRFIRVVLRQRVLDSCQDLEYGVWVSLSEKSFNNYRDTYYEGTPDPGYFGYLNSWLPAYASTIGLKTDVVTQPGRQRPIIELHQWEYDRHPFARDWFDGISLAEAERRLG